MKKVSYQTIAEKLPTFLEQFFDKEAATRCVEVILWTEKHNKTNQGLLKLGGTEPLQAVKPTAPIEIIDKTSVSALIKGNKQPSFYVAQRATDIAIQKAKASGIAIVGANGIFSSTGALGYYAERMAHEGLIGIVMARSPGAMTPFNTTTPLFGTNPVAFSFPTQGEPLVFDMATSAIIWYALVAAKMRGEKIPEGVAIDKDGNITTDPAAAMQGGILPFDRSHKGSGLSMIVELMSGPLVDASFCDFETFDKDWGFFTLCFKPDLLVDAEQFRKHTTELMDIVRAQGKDVRLPGDSGRAFAREVENGVPIDVDDEIATLLGL